MTPPLRIGARLRSARLRAGLTQAELAERAGLHAAAVGFFEQDARSPSLVNLVALAEALAGAMRVTARHVAAELLGL